MTSAESEKFAVPAVNVEANSDGSFVVTNGMALSPYPENIMVPLQRWVRERGDDPFLCERQEGDWRSMSYAEFGQRVRMTAAKLLALGCSEEKPLLILAPNSIAHALVSFAAMSVGVPAAAVSPAYALMTGSFGRLRQIVDVLKPGAIYLNPIDLFAPVISELEDCCRGPIICDLPGPHGSVQSLADLPEASLDQVRAAEARIGPDTIAKILFTSGSTGAPKGVKTTQRMLCSNQAALAQLWPFLEQTPPVLVDWLPWSHTFGGNVCFNSVLFHGGTLYIDDGKPAPHLIGRTVENLSRASHNLHFNVPAGIEALLPFLEKDTTFAKHFFESLNAVFVAGAALPQLARDRLTAAAIDATGEEPTLLAGWGSTETAPFSTCVYFETSRADNIGVPIPGTAIKMQPDNDKLALGVKGPNVTPGYWRNDHATQSAFDTDGFYRMGDAGRFVDPDAPDKGIAFDGRLSENFKLLSGTWVNVGMLRVKVIDRLRPLFLDAVITGHDRADVGLLLVPNVQAIAEYIGEPAADLTPDNMTASAKLTDEIKTRLSAHNAENPGSSMAVKQFAILPRAPEIGKGEITDKGYINQRAILENWRDLVDSLYDPDSRSLAHRV